MRKMICSFPFLDQLGYAPACAIHDEDYGEARTYRHKFRRDAFLAHNMRKLGEWHSIPIAFATFVVLSTNPFSYYKYFKNIDAPIGHIWTALWAILSVYQVWSYF